MDFLARLDGRSASVQVFHPDWRTLHFLVAAGPFKYRGHYVIGLRHLQAQMQTFGAGPPQRVQVAIDLESLATIAMKVTTNGGDGQRRSMVFSYAVEDDRVSGQFDISLPTAERGDVSGLNMTIHSSTVQSALLLAQNISFAYRNKLSEDEAFSISALWDKPRREALAHLVTRLHDVSVRGTHHVPVAGLHVVRVMSDFDGTRRPIEIRLQTRTPTKPLELRVDATYEKDRKLSLYAGMPTARLVSLQATRNLYGMHVDDASVSVRLNSSQLLSAVVQWRWQIAIDVKRRAVARLTALSADVQSWLADMTHFVQDEAARKERFIQPVINRQWQTVVEYTRAEFDAVAADFRLVRDEWRARYERDDLFMRTIYGIIRTYLQRGKDVLSLTTASTQKAFVAVRAALDGIVKDVQRGYKLLLRAVRLFSSAVKDYVNEEIDAMRAVGSEVGEAVWLLVNTTQELVDIVWSSVTSVASSLWTAAKDTGSRALAALRWAASPLLRGAGAGGSWVVRQVSEAFRVVADAFSELLDRVKGSLYEMMGVFKSQLLDIFNINSVEVSTPVWFSSLPGMEFVGKVASAAKHAVFLTYESATSFVKYNRAFFREAWIAVYNFLSQIPDDIPPVRILIDWLRRVYSETSWAWHYWEEGNQIRKAAIWIVNSMSENRNATGQGSGLNITDNAYVKFFPGDGFLQTNIPLPVKWNSFNELPMFGQNETTEANRLGLDIVYFYYELLDYINRVSPLFSAQEWLPPYDARALFAGTQHYITFDDRFYEFAGSCSYLLAADLKHQSFALVVHYGVSGGRAERRSLSVFHRNHSLHLVRGRSLFLDDRRVELPFRLGNTVVSRVGSRTVLDLGHSRVECNVAFDVCTVQLSGVFHGRTGGLLGTYNNEPADDFSGPSGKLYTRIDSFARKWEVRGDRQYCRARNFAISAASGGDDPRAKAACGALFSNPVSALRPCYGIVNTKPFMQMCLNDLEAHYNSPARYLLVCTAAAAYVAECATSGVDIWMPPQCVRCELEDGNVLHAAETTLYRSNAPRYADVVIVVERRTCQRERGFRQTTWAINDYLRRRGITQNRFAIIGYGGDDIYRRPHIETIKGEIWGNSRAAGQALDRVASAVTEDDNDVEPDDDSGVFEAIREGCRLPFRGGVSKHIVLFSCSSCPYIEEEFPFTLKVLNLMDVTLHIVADTNFHMNKASQQPDSKVVALGNRLAYTYKDLHSRRQAGSELLHPHVRPPKDLCSPLAIETNGTVFDAGRWGKPLRHLVGEVVAEAADPSPCQECDCFADRDGVGKLECRTCISAPLKVSTG
ncbi:Apolipophorin [Amphibalanus amphitrite]|uniref:Apolipophorin n=1 Tax=Amphibalanus amphitrite TaxID=1232801 RepID=A0A6A4W6N7_AMPAM|nr:Apolipophorin [Amphibalanus amphitrite]